MKNVVGLLSGFVFAAGLVLSGMTDANKVFAFLNIFFDWDVSLAFVMVGAISTFAGCNAMWGRKHKTSLLGKEPFAAIGQHMDAKLIIGAVFFGTGWGLLGFCPGPALVSLGTLDPVVLVFAASMAAGMMLFSLVDALMKSKSSNQ